MTLLLLWQEYIAHCEAAAQRPYSYSQFCDRYALYKKRLGRSVRLTHRAGEKVFVDYSGKKARVFDRDTGEVREAEVFVMTLAASGYSYAEASWSQTVPDFCSGLMRGFDFLGGAPEVLVPDQLRSAVSKPCRYDPEIHRTLADLAAHYQLTVLPARPRKPKDKAKVEGAVLLVQRWVLAKIRNERFESLEELSLLAPSTPTTDVITVVVGGHTKPTICGRDLYGFTRPWGIMLGQEDIASHGESTTLAHELFHAMTDSNDHLMGGILGSLVNQLLMKAAKGQAKAFRDATAGDLLVARFPQVVTPHWTRRYFPQTLTHSAVPCCETG